jgi:hypothetical protein
VFFLYALVRGLSYSAPSPPPPQCNSRQCPATSRHTHKATPVDLGVVLVSTALISNYFRQHVAGASGPVLRNEECTGVFVCSGAATEVGRGGAVFTYQPNRKLLEK